MDATESWPERMASRSLLPRAVPHPGWTLIPRRLGPLKRWLVLDMGNGELGPRKIQGNLGSGEFFVPFVFQMILFSWQVGS